MGKRKRASTQDKRNLQRDNTANELQLTYESLPTNMKKYWNQRYRLFSRFDDGVYMDQESWYSVTPEPLAIQIAREVHQCGARIIIDGFCGAGGNSIAFAKDADLVYAWDIDPVKIECAKHNAQIYGVSERIHFQVGNFFDLIESVQADCVFLSPPWGGPAYNTQNVFDINAMQPYNAKQLMIAARQVTKNVILYLPRQSNQSQIAALQAAPGSIELQYLKCSGAMKALCCYFGNLATPVEN